MKPTTPCGPPATYRTRVLAAALALAACVIIVLAASPPVSVSASAGGAPPPPTSPSPFATGEVLVKFRPGVMDAQSASVLSGFGARQVDEISPLGLRRLQVPAGSEEAVATALARNPNVLYAHPNGIIAVADTIPNDPFWGNQWNMRAISAPAAWGVVTGSVPVTVAVIDTGIDGAHPDLQGQTVPGYYQYTENSVTYSGPIPPGTTNDPYGHGTHVSGIVAARTNNGVGVAGVSWGARIMPFRSQASDGSGTEFDLAAGLIWVTDNGAKVVNISLGGTTSDAGLADAVAYAWGHDVVVVAAAGNFNWCSEGAILFPGAYPYVLAVAATDSSDNRASFSCYGPEVDLAAPGAGVYSTYYHRFDAFNFTRGYGYMSGTSMATPHVAGLAALIRSLNPALTNVQVTAILTSTTDLVGTDPYVTGWNQFLGAGRINAQAAVVGRMDLSGSAAADIGAPITYVLTVYGSALDAAVPAVITAAVPEGASFVSASDGGVLAGGVVSWTVAPIAPLAVATRSLVVTATSTVTANVYGGTRGGGTIIAPARSVVTRLGPALVVAKTGPALAIPGDPITYMLAVTNTGVQAATGLVITDALPAGAHLISAGDGALMPGGVISWTAASLAPGARLERTLVVTASTTITNADYGVVCQELGSAAHGPAVRTNAATYISYWPLLRKDVP